VTIFTANNKEVEIIDLKKNKGNQPPKKIKENNALIKSMFAYSPKKKSAKGIALYSTL
jgi:hypothetical protein